MNISLAEIKNILADTDRARTENLARQAANLTRQFFGRAISLYSPLYLSNYCSSQCTYCGFNSHNSIKRLKLSADEIRQEMRAIAAEGIENILLLTGESHQVTPLAYLKEAVTLGREHFSCVTLEVYPLATEEYRELFLAGADGVTIYQETYDRVKYAEVHPAGIKRDYKFRLGTPARAAEAGMRHLSLGILLGLGDVAEDLWALYQHLHMMEKNFPGVEYSVSFPRLRRIKGKNFATCHVDDPTFIKILCLTRILFPRVGINLSTRESTRLRDHALELGVTRVSAGSRTVVGGYISDDTTDAAQFDIEDHRSVKEMIALLKEKNFDPVFTDWRAIRNN